MLKWIKEFWKKHKGEIIAGLIVTIIGGLILTALLSQQFREVAFKCMDKIQNKVYIPFYWLLTMFALGVVMTRLLIRRANKKTRKYYFNNMDEVHGLVWEWSSFSPDAVKPLCPKCLTEIILITDKQEGEGFECHCVSCDFKKVFDVDRLALLGLVKLELGKRKRTGEDKHAKDRVKAIRKLS